LSGPAAREILLSRSASAALRKLESSSVKEDQSIARRVRSLRLTLVHDCLHGEVVKKARIPASLVRDYGVENLFVEDLPSFRRLLYTIVHEGADRVIIVLEIVDHRAYDRWFPGRGR
jgi:hypothetical protein